MTTLNHAAAVCHPVRAATLLGLRACGSGASMSPSGVAAMLDLPLSNVSYHCKVLQEVGLLVLDDEVPVRGSLRHEYVLSPRFTGALVEMAEMVARGDLG